MYLSKAKKRNIIIVVVLVLVAAIVTAVLLTQKPKIESASISGSGYIGSELSASVTPLSASVTYQWKISDSATGPFTDIPQATASKLTLGMNDEGKYFMVTLKGTQDYAGKQDSPVMGPIKGITVTWPSTTPIIYGQSISSSGLGEGSAVLNGVVVPGSFRFKDTSAVPEAAGTYKATVLFTPDDLTNYKAVEKQLDVSVAKAKLTLSVTNVVVMYGDPIPKYNYQITGFVLGDDLTDITGTPSITSLYTPGLVVSYSPLQIIAEAGTLSSNNYDFKFVFGKLSINKKALTISGIYGRDKIYDGNRIARVSGKAVLVGIFNADAVYLGGYPKYTFAQSGVGNNIKITTTGYTLNGAKAANYTLVQPVLYADILPVPIPVPQ